VKPVLAVVSALFYFLVPHQVQSETCQDRAQHCVARWGAPPEACYGSFRLAACEKTGKYVAPNGNVWPAIRSGDVPHEDR
jgi:hypothetical protein